MPTNDSEQIAAYLAKWLHKPFVNWCVLANIGIAITAVAAAIATHIWWLLFIPVMAFIECSALYFGLAFAEALRARETEIERLRRKLSMV